jgi:hypothetical protein
MAYFWLVDVDAPLADQPDGASGAPGRNPNVVMIGGCCGMYDNNPELKRRLSSWQRSAGVVESSPDTGAVREHMRSQNSVLRTLLLETVAEIDTTMYALDSYLDQGDHRSVTHEQRLDERTASALHTYERAVARVLDRGFDATLRDLPREREVVKTVYIQPPPPRPWWKRIFVG